MWILSIITIIINKNCIFSLYRRVYSTVYSVLSECLWKNLHRIRIHDLLLTSAIYISIHVWFRKVCGRTMSILWSTVILCWFWKELVCWQLEVSNSMLWSSSGEFRTEMLELMGMFRSSVCSINLILYLYLLFTINRKFRVHMSSVIR